MAQDQCQHRENLSGILVSYFTIQFGGEGAVEEQRLAC